MREKNIIAHARKQLVKDLYNSLFAKTPTPCLILFNESLEGMLLLLLFF